MLLSTYKQCLFEEPVVNILNLVAWQQGVISVTETNDKLKSIN
jgi:hypothetical protein